MRIFWKSLLKKKNTWVTLNTTGSYNNIKHLNNKYIAVGDSGSIAYSNDGISYTETTVGSANWANICYFKGKYVICGGNQVKYSEDLTNWSDITVDSSYDLKFMACDDKTLVVAGDNGELLSTSDFNGFTSYTLSVEGLLHYGVCFDGDRFVLISVKQNSGTYITTSYYNNRDQLTWYSPNLAVANIVIGNVDVCNGNYVFTIANTVYTTDDLSKNFSEWNSVELAYTICALHCKNNTIIAMTKWRSQGGLITYRYREYHIQNNNIVNVLSGYNQTKISTSNDKVVAVGETAKIYYKYL